MVRAVADDEELVALEASAGDEHVIDGHAAGDRQLVVAPPLSAPHGVVVGVPFDADNLVGIAPLQFGGGGGISSARLALGGCCRSRRAGCRRVEFPFGIDHQFDAAVRCLAFGGGVGNHGVVRAVADDEELVAGWSRVRAARTS